MARSEDFKVEGFSCSIVYFEAKKGWKRNRQRRTFVRTSERKRYRNKIIPSSDSHTPNVYNVRTFTYLYALLFIYISMYMYIIVVSFFIITFLRFLSVFPLKVLR